MRVYLDNAATTPMDPQVIEAMTKVMSEEFGNPSSTHSHGRVVRTLIEEARKKVAHLLNCTPGEIFFTSGGTEADNMAIRKSVLDLGVKNIITSPIEHHAVLHTIEELAHEGKVKMHLVNLLTNGHVDLTHLEELLANNEHALVSLMHANNELGNLLDIDKVGELCQQFKAYFHCDTVQTMGHYALDTKKTHVHFLACGAHKFNGPKGVGFIYINHEAKISPYITGGAQERNMRGGTENVYGIIGLAKALELAYANIESEKAHIQGLKTYMLDKLRANIPGIQFNGDAEGSSLYTVLNANFPPSPYAEMILFKLDIAGISASGGSACSSGSNVGSHVLTALKVPADRPSVRFSFGKQNTKEEIDYVVEKMVEIYPSQANN
ncbi:MAG: cysteine desulfurase [Bacteroidia bacterium]|nr:cysteine desulfurase [Bacteroidia bacterium]MCF8425426.1 cysteine desulfurase [Bacteroidia bacterium]MCF8447212.1 cysteine desulfurase [Bacteroidia bacterium]